MVRGPAAMPRGCHGATVAAHEAAVRHGRDIAVGHGEDVTTAYRDEVKDSFMD